LPPTPRTRGLLAAIIAVGVLAVGATPASAGILTQTADACGANELSRPFMPWADGMRYFLAPGGSFESRAGTWQLSGGARVVKDADQFQISGLGDDRSLSLPDGSSATSKPMCVGVDAPSIRYIARNTGDPLTTLRVEALFEDATGAVHSVVLQDAWLPSSWQPVLPVLILANLTPNMDGGGTAVAFRFTPNGGQWSIDDVWVDPFSRN
jgi:hypothetical protein